MKHCQTQSDHMMQQTNKELLVTHNATLNRTGSAGTQEVSTHDLMDLVLVFMWISKPTHPDGQPPCGNSTPCSSGRSGAL